MEEALKKLSSEQFDVKDFVDKERQRRREEKERELMDQQRDKIFYYNRYGRPTHDH